MLNRKTRDVAREIGVPYTLIYSRLRSGRLAPPGKDSAGDYVWTDADVERARKELADVARQRAG
jgi:hypothetical protein